MHIKILLTFLLLTNIITQTITANVVILNQQIVDEPQKIDVIKDNVLKDVYNDTKYNGVLNCQNGYLNIIDVSKGNRIVFGYSGMANLNSVNTHVSVSPNRTPFPYLTNFIDNQFTLIFNCPVVPEYDADNYFNKVDVSLLNQGYRFSFLLNCDPGKRHKLFQYGYLILAGLDAFILIGVALHSEVWSLKYKGRRLGLPIHWPYVLFIMLVVVAVSLILYFAAFKDFQTAFVGLHYFGIAFSGFFVFICLNETFYIFKIFRTSVYKKIRICQILSLVIAITAVILAFFIDNWIFHNILAICICVASIKIFYFPSLKQAYICKLIIVVIFTTLSIVIHYVAPERSYNDYATQLSSPLFLVVPDLVHNLFKKCSWLFILDIIIPGVMLSFLRQYDVNRGSGFLGVYTIYGNLTVIIGTIVWVAIQYGYGFSVPFSLVTYFFLMVVTFIVSWTRNEWKDLWSGMFQKQNSIVDESKLSQKKESFKDLVTQDILDPLVRGSQSESVPSKGSQNRQ